MSGVSAGWFPDPTGRSEQRYWDGNAWTDNVARGDNRGTDAISGDYAPPQAAPIYIVQNQRRKWPWIVLAVFVLGMAGCGVLFIAGINSAVSTLNAEQRAHAISNAQFEAVPLGTRRADVVKMLGKQPENSQEFVSQGVIDRKAITASCIYYNKIGGGFGPRYQFCFLADGTLDTKNAYS
jgi:hypothetical protein